MSDGSGKTLIQGKSLIQRKQPNIHDNSASLFSKSNCKL